MRHRWIHAAAAILNGTAIGAALTGLPRLAVASLFASVLLLVWSLEKFRVRLNGENLR